MINHKYKCIFIHYPSTGGTSIERALGEGAEKFTMGEFYFNNKPYTAQSDKHLSTSLTKKLYPDAWQEYFKFSIVRNPWDWLTSLWAKGERRRRGKPFGEWLNHPTLAPHEQQPIEFYDDLIKEVDYIGKFENLPESFSIICEHLNLPLLHLPHLQRSPARKHYTKWYTPETQAQVERRFRQEIQRFGYKFKLPE